MLKTGIDLYTLKKSPSLGKINKSAFAFHNLEPVYMELTKGYGFAILMLVAEKAL